MAVTEGGKSALMRRLVASGRRKSAVRATTPTRRPAKVTIKLSESELHLLATIAPQRGMTRTEWIVALVRARFGSPVQT